VPKARSLAIALAMAMTACGAGQNSAGQNSAAGGSTELAVANSPELGRYVTDGQGRALYVFSGDQRAESRCYDGCAVAWAPVPPMQSRESAEPAIQSDLIGSASRREGTSQTTYGGRPLYARSATGGEPLQRSITDQFGSWSLVFPHGEPFVPLR
jgi:predicted lipoprotein with Yx(FWY)xxD motif